MKARPLISALLLLAGLNAAATTDDWAVQLGRQLDILQRQPDDRVVAARTRVGR